MAKKQKEFVAFGQMTKKAKFLHFLKIFGISFGAVLGLVAGVILYVFATGGFNPPYVPLTSFNFSQDEYVIDTNNQIMLDEEGNQIKNEDGDLMFEQITDTEGNPVYSYVMIVPNEGCTELDAVVQLKDWTDTEPCIQFVEDDNVVAIREDGEGPEDICYKYNVKINSPIYIKTKTINQNGTFRLLNGWIRLLATNVVDGKPGMITTSTWVYVDTSVEQLEISLRNADSFESEVIAVGQENVDFYDVYPNSNINIQNSILPLQSMASPSSNVPSSKGTTSFRDVKTVVYQSSDPDIATVDATGRVSIVPHKEGQTFSIYAYIISKFSDINNMPNITDYADDTTNAYKKAVNRICVFSNVLHFKINEIAVSELTTLKDGANRVSYNYNVFETGRITFNNDSTKTVAKNNYFVDLVLTDSADDSFKQELLSNIKLYVAIEGDLLSESEISSINEGSYLISQITDLPVNNHHIADASRYISIDEKTHQYVINEYSQNNFYLIFYYGSIEGSVKYDYIPFTISKVSVQGISTRGNSINMTYEEEGGDNVSETYALNSNNFATINPTTATYTTLLYFVCNAENGTKIVEVDDSISLNINSKNYYLVKFESNGRRDYGTIHPVSYGRVTLYAVVLRTLPTTVIYDSETGAPISPINFTPLTIAGQDVKLLKNTSGELDFEYYSNPITLTISKDAIFNGIQQYTKTQENVYNKSDKVNFVSDPTKPDYPSDKTDSDLYAEINQGGEFAVQVNYTGELIDVEGTKLQVVHVQGADTTVASVSKVNNTIVGEYYFSILANKVGTTQFQIIYNGSKGEQSVGTIGIKVLSTELVEMDIDASNKTINLNFTVDGEGKATGFDWDYLEMNLGFKSTETEATGFELRTYIIPEDFDTSKVALYQNKQFDEEISGIAEKYNSIQKLVQWLTITDDYIKISNDFTTVRAGTRQKNTIYVTANGTKYAFAYDFVSSGSVLLFASSTSTTICSNPVLVNIVLPTVTVQYGDGNVGENSARVIAFGDIQTGGLLSLDNNITRAKSINLYLDGVDKIRFYANGTVNISDLVHFKFTKQTVDPLNLSLFKSQTSGA
ncbi:MAG: hypothetical protein J6T39_00765, partial [Clostridia bacterium]|nr:hypothetical protein [Clostridia bacterium]